MHIVGVKGCNTTLRSVVHRQWLVRGAGKMLITENPSNQDTIILLEHTSNISALAATDDILLSAQSSDDYNYTYLANNGAYINKIVDEPNVRPISTAEHVVNIGPHYIFSWMLETKKVLAKANPFPAGCIELCCNNAGYIIALSKPVGIEQSIAIYQTKYLNYIGNLSLAQNLPKNHVTLARLETLAQGMDHSDLDVWNVWEKTSDDQSIYPWWKNPKISALNLRLRCEDIKSEMKKTSNQ